jgi:hypothetical protein
VTNFGRKDKENNYFDEMKCLKTKRKQAICLSDKAYLVTSLKKPDKINTLQEL